MSKNDNCFGSNAGDRTGVYKLNDYSSYVLQGSWWQVAGQDEFLTPGSYTWLCPPGVNSVSAVCVGAGGGGQSSWASPAGGGGGLGWKNNISVTPGQSYTVVVGTKGTRNSQNGGDSYFISRGTVAGGGGGMGGNPGGYSGMGYSHNGTGGGYSGDGGGRGGTCGYNGGGGAGGYAGNGGDSQSNSPTNSGSGAGGGYYSSTYGTGAGGGVGIYGRRTDLNALQGSSYGNDGNGKGCGVNSGSHRWNSGQHNGLGGEGGSRRTGIISGEFTGYSGCSGENPWGFGYNTNDIQGGFPGGGGGGPGTSYGGGDGGGGAVRIMWGGELTSARSYPDTNCEDQT